MASRPASRFAWGLLVALGIAAFGLAAVQVLEVGFLADDYYAGRGVLDHAKLHPGIGERIATTFTTKWAEGLEFWHRPILALGVQADYALFGADGRRHHWVSLGLWVCVAASAAAVARRLFGNAAAITPWIVFAGALLHPAGVEALCWLVARDDLLFATFGLQAVRARLDGPLSVVAPLPWIALGLLSKESASVLVPLMNVASLLRICEPSERPPTRVRVVVREIAPWILLGVWFGFRYTVLGGIGASYGPSLYFENLGVAHVAGRFAQSFLQLVAPVNSTIVPMLGIAPFLLKGAMIVPAAVLLAGLVRGRQPGDLRRALFLLAGIAAPLVLLSPVLVVTSELTGGRGLVFPGACWILLLGLAWDRARIWPHMRAVVTPVWFLGAAVSFVATVTPYVIATHEAEEALKSLDRIPPGATAVLLGTHDPVAAMRPDTLVIAGAYVLSAGIHPAMGPPFRRAPPVTLVIPQSDDAILSAPPGEPRPWVATLRGSAFGTPRFRVLAEGDSVAADGIELTPPHRAEIRASEPVIFSIRAPDAVWRRIATLHLTAVEPGGTEARALIQGEALVPRGGIVQVPGATLSPAVDGAALQSHGVSVVLWWAEARAADGSLVFRSPWQALAVPRRS
jgi:hypothetical protein